MGTFADRGVSGAPLARFRHEYTRVRPADGSGGPRWRRLWAPTGGRRGALARRDVGTENRRHGGVLPEKQRAGESACPLPVARGRDGEGVYLRDRQPGADGFRPIPRPDPKRLVWAVVPRGLGPTYKRLAKRAWVG